MIKLLRLSATIILMLPIMACNGIFADIYDSPEDNNGNGESEFGFTVPCTESTPGTIYIDATDFLHWIYIDFSEQSVETLGIFDQAPENWDIALHHYDVKTNGAMAAPTTAQTVASAIKGDGFSVGEYEADTWTNDKIAVDLSDMMSGNIVYCESWYNRVISSWMSVDIQIMPPVYVHSGKVFSVRLADGGKVFLRLANYVNQAGSKGYLTIEYQYNSGV